MTERTARDATQRNLYLVVGILLVGIAALTWWNGSGEGFALTFALSGLTFLIIAGSKGSRSR